ncbi:MAG TPA: hypothetical protein VEK79_04770 [Thermoanaerobaculia bacterium]|nr:hypothetical protein [Thermoanaerobaculia bacterium]
MGPILLVHIIAGGLGLVSGYIALYSAKGAPLHRKPGIVFVYAMLTMCVPGLIIAIGRNVAPAINVPAAFLTASLVLTALTTVLMFGAVGLLAAAGDFRLMRSGPLEGARRIARHLWRMTFALFIAALSFFIGQAKVLPEAIRIPGLLALPVLAVLIAMFYWLWRVRAKRPVTRRIPWAIPSSS